MTNDIQVIIVGAGPTGLALANQLALAGIHTRIVERREDESNLTRAFAVHARTLELLDARGLAEEVLARGVRVSEVQGLPGVVFDLGELSSQVPMVGVIPQSGTEAVWSRAPGVKGCASSAARTWSASKRTPPG